MTITLEAWNLIVPIDVIERKYPGGWKQCREDHGLAEHASSFAACWHDGQLFRDGAMDQLALALLVENWESLGFRATRRRGGEKVSADFCVYAAFSDGPEHPCDWIDIDTSGGTAGFRPPLPSNTVTGGPHG